jgi:putative transposase
MSEIYQSLPPKHPVASVIGFLKGKSSIAIARQLCGKERNFAKKHFWAVLNGMKTGPGPAER